MTQNTHTEAEPDFIGIFTRTADKLRDMDRKIMEQRAQQEEATWQGLEQLLGMNRVDIIRIMYPTRPEPKR
jgi:hypothetical protein